MAWRSAGLRREPGGRPSTPPPTSAQQPSGFQPGQASGQARTQYLPPRKKWLPPGQQAGGGRGQGTPVTLPQDKCICSDGGWRRKGGLTTSSFHQEVESHQQINCENKLSKSSVLTASFRRQGDGDTDFTKVQQSCGLRAAVSPALSASGSGRLGRGPPCTPAPGGATGWDRGAELQAREGLDISPRSRAPLTLKPI